MNHDQRIGTYHNNSRTGTLRCDLTNSGKVGEWQITWNDGRREAGNVQNRLTLAHWMEREKLFGM